MNKLLKILIILAVYITYNNINAASKTDQTKKDDLDYFILEFKQNDPKIIKELNDHVTNFTVFFGNGSIESLLMEATLINKEIKIPIYSNRNPLELSTFIQFSIPIKIKERIIFLDFNNKPVKQLNHFKDGSITTGFPIKKGKKYVITIFPDFNIEHSFSLPRNNMIALISFGDYPNIKYLTVREFDIAQEREERRKAIESTITNMPKELVNLISEYQHENLNT